jgi:hypothetical protein
MTWGDFEAAAPALADRAQVRLEETRVALLGTIRADGSPRISPIEPYFAPGVLLLGAMASSAKARDLLRDARCVLHSVVTAPDAGEPEFKLYGRAAEVTEPSLRDVRAPTRGGWPTLRTPRGCSHSRWKRLRPLRGRSTVAR